MDTDRIRANPKDSFFRIDISKKDGKEAKKLTVLYSNIRLSKILRVGSLGAALFSCIKRITLY